MEGSAVLSGRDPVRSRKGAARAPFVQRYWAFLSYSHRDAADAEWLHRAIEKFRVPKALVGRRVERFLVPARLTPVFRDRSELAASKDLSEEIRQAIECSRHLIVLCSPAAAQSRWVNEEIRQFRRLRPDGEVLAVIVSGEPGASAIPGRESEECFPPALREACDSLGRPTGEAAEPIAADLRPEADGRAGGLLKLVAGLLDVTLDDLVQRDEQRRQRRLARVAGGSILGMVVASGLALTAIQARDMARDQRREAEGLVGFMIGDLKDRLEPVGRLDALDAVGSRVLAYYERQDKGDLSDEGLAQRSRALTLMGDIAQRRGDLDRALRLYREGFAGTQEALRRDSANPQRLYDHAQNVFWIGNIAWERGRRDTAARYFRDYKSLAERMVAAQPGKAEWQLERVYAGTNMGILELERRRFGEAVAAFRQSLGASERLVAAEPGNRDYRGQQLAALAYLADALDRAGQLDAARGQRLRQLRLVERQLGAGPRDTTLESTALIANQAMALLEAASGRSAEAQQFAAKATALGERLIEAEPNSANWNDITARAHLVAADVALRAGRPEMAQAQVERGCALAEQLAARDRRNATWQMRMLRCMTARTRLAAATGKPAEALINIGRAEAATAMLASGDPIEDQLQRALVVKLAGDVQARMGERGSARASWERANMLWPRGVGEAPTERGERADLLRQLGRTGEAREIERGLGAQGYRDPRVQRID